jgi:phosphoglycerol transferase MdoB-like AlkP superfamily enzyme
MKNALWVLGCVATGIGFILAVVTAWFAFGFFIRIIAFLVALIGVVFFAAFVMWSWWTECVVEPYRVKRKKKRGQ